MCPIGIDQIHRIASDVPVSVRLTDIRWTLDGVLLCPAHDVERLQARDEVAWGELHARFSGPLHRHLKRTLRDREEESPDVAQEIFAKVFRHIGELRATGGAPLDSWFWTVAHNCVHDHLRARRPVHSEDPAMIDERRANLPDRDAGAQAASAQTHELLALMLRLPADQRDLLVLRHVQGLTTHEIAHVLGRSENAIQKLETRAREYLAARLTSRFDLRGARQQRAA
jgi:RNA polymerase sigma-70 factor, ECF subfamily